MIFTVKRNGLFLLLMFCAIGAVPAFDVWQHPEAAERNSLFVAGSAVVVAFDDSLSFTIEPQFNFDYMLPLRFPFSFGAFLKTPEPNLNSFGTRLSYHINLDRPRTDLYFLYVFDFGFTRNDILVEYNDEARPIYYYDFRIGIRQRIGRYIFIQAESDFQFRGIVLGIAAKIF
jgi:hypothetical protein